MNKFHVIDGRTEKSYKPRTPIQLNDFQGDFNRFFRRSSIIIQTIYIMRQPPSSHNGADDKKDICCDTVNLI